MRLVLSFCLLSLFAVSCASHHPGSEAEKEAQLAALGPAYGGNCAMGMCKKKVVPGKLKYKVDYRGNRYVFSSEEARDTFLSDLDKNIATANAEWASRANSMKPR